MDPSEPDVIFRVNEHPNGQWAWIQQHTGLPIAAAIATALEKGAASA